MVCLLGKSFHELQPHWLLVEHGENTTVNIFTQDGLFVREGTTNEMSYTSLQEVDVLSLFYQNQPCMLLDTALLGTQRINLTQHPTVVKKDMYLRGDLKHLFVRILPSGVKQEIFIFHRATLT